MLLLLQLFEEDLVALVSFFCKSKTSFYYFRNEDVLRGVGEAITVGSDENNLKVALPYFFPLSLPKLLRRETQLAFYFIFVLC